MAHLVERTVVFEAGWTKRDSISDVGYQLNGWGTGRDYLRVRSRIRGMIKSRFRWWTWARFWYLQNRNFLYVNVVLDEWVVRA